MVTSTSGILKICIDVEFCSDARIPHPQLSGKAQGSSDAYDFGDLPFAFFAHKGSKPHQDAKDIVFYHDPEDTVPLCAPSSAQPTSSTTPTGSDAFSVLLKAGCKPAPLTAGACRSICTSKPSAHLCDADNTCSHPVSSTSSTARKRALSSATEQLVMKKVALQLSARLVTILPTCCTYHQPSELLAWTVDHRGLSEDIKVLAILEILRGLRMTVAVFARQSTENSVTREIDVEMEDTKPIFHMSTKDITLEYLLSFDIEHGLTVPLKETTPWLHQILMSAMQTTPGADTDNDTDPDAGPVEDEDAPEDDNALTAEDEPDDKPEDSNIRATLSKRMLVNSKASTPFREEY
ncbi:uncharacterized protein EDB91DRAFT_1311635 [Suillus paluster]|uniref:uncharacterized protein n=1 Tax=Suillus paluster TaxID=48578 RepID=UPI001B8721CE|nr:uncharacterized protein EDB91DRAFT_1311635 [Suillus paluster]KAG1729219.1 hypothetical protein EDB91DRAFT_1311635 [Suillus paluster]